MVECFAKDVGILSVVLPDGRDQSADFRTGHAATQFTAVAQMFYQPAFGGGGGDFYINILRLFRFQIDVGATLLAECGMLLFFPNQLGLFKLFFLFATQPVVMFLNGVHQIRGEAYRTFAGCRRCGDGRIEVCGVFCILVDEAGAGQAGAAIVQTSQEHDVFFARVGSVLDAFLQEAW